MGGQAGNVITENINSSAGWDERAAYYIEKSRLAGTIRTDDSPSFSQVDYEIDIVGCLETTEILVNFFDYERFHNRTSLLEKRLMGP